MAHTHDHPEHAPTHGPDTRAAFLGLVIGAIVLFAIIRGIVYLTNSHYQSERPAAESTR
jgi:hypothetical protein